MSNKDDESQYSKYWESDEFEDLDVRSLIGLYETKIKAEKKGVKCSRFDLDTFNRLRKFGCYFPANDRVVVMKFNLDNKASAIQQIDIVNDGLPDRAIVSSNPEELVNDYLWSFFVERVPFLPKPFIAPRKGKVYRAHQIYFGNKYVEGCGTYVIIDNEGNIESCYIPGSYVQPITGRTIHFENRPRLLGEGGEAVDFYSAWASTTIQLFQDRNHLWNVQAKEGIAKATFSVHQEQIKSLFYARDLQPTATGRKRPILHWVNAHQRRMKSGTDVDIDQYLRGQNEFVMDGTQFVISNPQKQKKENK